jgi:hypothetical protein
VLFHCSRNHLSQLERFAFERKCDHLQASL